jgi:exopolysaccharide biosynthesis predicted pyruvyltransferase EpsI
LLEINSRSFYLPDLVYSLVPNIFAKTKIAKSVLIIPNVNVVPKVSDPHWKHAAWSYFKSEFVQFLDWLISNQYNLSFFSMCHAAQIEDDWASAELIGHMKHRSSNLLLQDRPQTIDEVVSLISQYELVITQRFHGIVFSDIARVPHITIHHHDKLKQWGSNHISYYNGSKQAFIDAMMAQLQPPCIIDPAVFLAFSTEVLNLIGG